MSFTGTTLIVLILLVVIIVCFKRYIYSINSDNWKLSNNVVKRGICKFYGWIDGDDVNRDKTIEIDY